MIDFKLWTSNLSKELVVAVRGKKKYLANRGNLYKNLKDFSDRLEKDGSDYFYFKKYFDCLVENKALSNIGKFGISISPDQLLKEIIRFVKLILTSEHFEVLYRVYALSDWEAITEISQMINLLVLDFVPLLERPQRGMVAEFFDYIFHFSLQRKDLIDAWFMSMEDEDQFRDLEPWFLLTDHIPYWEDFRTSPDKWMSYPPYYFARRYFENSDEAFYCDNFYETSYIEALVRHLSKFGSSTRWFIKSSDLTSFFIDLFRVNNKRLQGAIRPFYVKMIIISEGSLKSLLVNDLIEFLLQDWLEKKDLSDFILLVIRNSQELRIKRIDHIISVFFSKVFKDLNSFDKNDFSLFGELVDSPRFDEIVPEFLCKLEPHDAHTVLSHSSLALFDEKDILEQISFQEELIPSDVGVTRKLNEKNSMVRFFYLILLNFFSNDLEENELMVQIFRKFNTFDGGKVLITTNIFVSIIKILLDLSVSYEHSDVNIMSRVTRIIPDPDFVRSLGLELPDSNNFIESSVLIENIRLFKEFYVIVYSSMHIKHGSYFKPT